MNRYIFIHRLTGPAILLLLGLVALLSQAHLVRGRIFVPLLLILLGVLKLAERAALAQIPNQDQNANPYVDPYANPYSASGNYGPYNPYGAGAAQQPYPSGAPNTGTTSTAIVPAHQNGSDTDEDKQ
jgi:hypothetical protein